jgi:hypothetical protein
MCIHAAVAAFAAFSFHVITASAAAAVPGHSPRSDKHTPMFSAICFFITPPPDTLAVFTPFSTITPVCLERRMAPSSSQIDWNAQSTVPTAADEGMSTKAAVTARLVTQPLAPPPTAAGPARPQSRLGVSISGGDRS